MGYLKATNGLNNIFYFLLFIKELYYLLNQIIIIIKNH
jgi:hypothetical protein